MLGQDWHYWYTIDEQNWSVVSDNWGYKFMFRHAFKSVAGAYRCVVWGPPSSQSKMDEYNIFMVSSSRQYWLLRYWYENVITLIALNAEVWTQWSWLYRQHFQMHIVAWYFHILFQISLKFVSEGQTDNKLALIHVMAWCRLYAKPLPESMAAKFYDVLCVTRP